MRVNNSERPSFAPGIRSLINTWNVWLVNFWILASNKFKDDVMVSLSVLQWVGAAFHAEWGTSVSGMALAMIRGAFSSKSLILSISIVGEVSQGDCSYTGWNIIKPCTLRWSARWTVVFDLSLAAKRNFNVEVSSWLWKAAWAAPKQMLVTLSFQKLYLILSQELSTVGFSTK